MNTPTDRRLLHGARAIARYALKDETRIHAVYEMRELGELPIFKLNGQLYAYADAVDEVMLKKEQAALDACYERQEILARRIAARLAECTSV